MKGGIVRDPWVVERDLDIWERGGAASLSVPGGVTAWMFRGNEISFG